MGQFLQWNPNETNQETDAQYLADSQRASGAVNDTPLPAPLGNKAFYQWSTFCAAFGQMMANKPGAYVLDDSSESALAAVLANILTESDTEPNIISVAYSPTPAFNAADSNGFQMALSGNITSSTISGVTAGQLLAFYFAQDSAGSRTVNWPAVFTGTVQPDPTPNSVSVILFRADLGGTARAVSPLISNNGVFFASPTSFSSSVSVSGNLTAPTQESSDNSTNAATTAWCRFGFDVNLAAKGHIKFPSWLGGFMVQWASGSQMSSVGSQGISWDINFANQCLAAFTSTIASGGDGDGTNLSYFTIDAWNQSTATVYFHRNADHAYDPATPVVLGIGY
jgi:hypothetical protein